jgi:predicted PurR-regulated permease PerM
MQPERGPFLSNPFVARAARWGLLSWSLIGMLALAWVVFRYVLYPIRIIYPPLVVALIVIYLLGPIVDELNRRGLRRGIATLVVYLVVMSAIAAVLTVLVDVIATQVSTFVSHIPGLLRHAQSGVAGAAKRLGVHVDTATLARQFERNGSVFNFLNRLTSFTSGVVHVAFVLVLGPLIAFYLLVDLPRLQRGAVAFVPASRREEVGRMAHDVNGTLGGFFRGQLLVALAMGLVSMFLFWFVGLPYFALLAAITGLFALVPLIGTVIAAIPALFVALTASHDTGGVLHLRGGWPLALATAFVLVAVQELDTRLLSPRVLSRTASRMNPVTILLSLLVGGTLLGLWGMLLAVPVVAAVKVVVLDLWDVRSSWPPRPSEEPALTSPPDTAAPVPPEPSPRRRRAAGSDNGPTRVPAREARRVEGQTRNAPEETRAG